MELVKDAEGLENSLRGERPVFVPTMGALHEGHLALIRRAAEIGRSEGSPVVVSVFVNPTQFGPDEDFARYPRMLERDAAGAASAGAAILFAPEAATVYPDGDETAAPQLPEVATHPRLEDAHRPGHFAGVCQVVARLFDLVHPSAAVFGEKDYQQLLVVEAMARQQADRWPSLKIVRHATMREKDGLAMSSRNAFLKADERVRAVALWKALNAARAEREPSQAERVMERIVDQHGLSLDYAVVRDAATLMPLARQGQPARALIAARLGSVRLIDNASLGDP